MEIKKKIVVPTGEIYTAIGEKGMLEFLTVGDYMVRTLISKRTFWGLPVI